MGKWLDKYVENPNDMAIAEKVFWALETLARCGRESCLFLLIELDIRKLGSNFILNSIAAWKQLAYAGDREAKRRLKELAKIITKPISAERPRNWERDLYITLQIDYLWRIRGLTTQEDIIESVSKKVSAIYREKLTTDAIKKIYYRNRPWWKIGK